MTDWCVGDLAVCVDTSQRVYNGVTSLGGDFLSDGATYRVTWVGRRVWRGASFSAIRVAGIDHPGFDADRFRKIRPDAHEACEDEFVTLLKRTKVSA